MTRNPIKQTIAVLAAFSFAGMSYGASLLSGTIAIGVNAAGHLNAADAYNLNTNANALGVTAIGVGDATAPGLMAEGWGVSAGTVSGFANVHTDLGVNNLTVDSFTTDDLGSGPGTFATSSVHVTSLPGLQVTQAYAASLNAPTKLFENKVTITNATGVALTDVRYVRVMDWDIPPTEFREYVTIKGTATTTQLELSTDNGFSTANPLGTSTAILPGTTNTDFVDSGTSDHGAYFRFNFGTLAAGDSISFSIFYGAAPNEASMLAGLAAEAVELYSLGQNSHAARDTQTTFAFAFKGVGGDPAVSIGTVPDTGATLGLLGLSMVGLMALQHRRGSEKRA